MRRSILSQAAFVFTVIAIVFGGLEAGAQPGAASATRSATVTPAACALSGSPVIRSAPAVGDIDNDGVKEIVVGGSDGKLHAINPDCSYVSGWPVQVNDFFVPPLVQTQSATQDIESTPALADIDGDGFLEIVVGVGWKPIPPYENIHENGGVIVLEHNGAVKTNWPKVTLDIIGAGVPAWNPDGFSDAVFSTPAVGDIDGDGQPEIVYGAFDKCIYAWNANGAPVAGWWDTANDLPARCLIDTIWSSPALADLDRDGMLDIVIGTDADPNYAGGSVWALKGDNTVMWTKYTTQVIVSSPAIGDINADGYPEIVVGTGGYYPQGYKGSSDGHKVYAFDRMGNDLPGWPQATTGNMPASPSLADLDGDGKLEIVIGCGLDSDFDSSTASCNKLYVWRYNGQSLSPYPTTITRSNPWAAGQGPAGIPYVAPIVDYNNDGTLDLFVLEAGSWGISVFPYNNPGAVDPFAYHADYALSAAPAIENLYNDNRLQMIAAGTNAAGTQGRVYIWQISTNSNGARPWPMARRDVRRTGSVPMRPSLAVAPASIYVLHQAGAPGTERATLNLSNAGDGTLNWSITSKPSQVTVSPMSGNMTTQTQLAVTVSATGSAGTYLLGNIVINANATDGPVLGVPASIPVRLYVGPVSRVFVPLLVKTFAP